MQPRYPWGAESPEAIAFCKERGIRILHDLCLMMERRRAAGV